MAKESIRDPVCGMAVTTDDAIVREFDGEKYYFCSERCTDVFEDGSHEYAYRSQEPSVSSDERPPPWSTTTICLDRCR